MTSPPPPVEKPRPRVGFAGVGWIGHHRMEAMAATGLIEVAAIAEPDAEAAAPLHQRWPAARSCDSFEELLDLPLDGVAIATPSALHAEQAIAALDRGLAVFCQKPLGRDSAETRAVVEAARRADRLLGVDLSYRHLRAVGAIRARLASGAIGHVYAVELIFHNAYGPDKSWYRDRTLAGGGCLIDLGIHLVDLAFDLLETLTIARVEGHLFAGGQPLADPATQVEDYASAFIQTAGGALIHLACSWNLPAGRDAIIEASFYGTSGGLRIANVGGSFYDFRGTSMELLAGPPDEWGGRAAAAWARSLAADRRYHSSVASILRVAEVLDAIYESARAGRCAPPLTAGACP